MTDREALAEEVLHSSFRTTRMGPGYRVAEVDAALDELAGRVRRGDDPTSVRHFVEALRFTHHGGQRSYGAAEVDAMLDRVLSALAGTAPEGTALEGTAGEGTAPVDTGFQEAGVPLAGEGPDPAPAPSAPLPSAVVENPAQGLFARIFRRR